MRTNLQNLTPKKNLQKSDAKAHNIFSQEASSDQGTPDPDDFFQRRLNFSLGAFDLEAQEKSSGINITPKKHSKKYSSPKHVIFSNNMEARGRDTELMEIEEQISNNLSPSTLNNSPDLFGNPRAVSGQSNGFAVPPLKEKSGKCMKKKNLLRYFLIISVKIVILK